MLYFQRNVAAFLRHFAIFIPKNSFSAEMLFYKGCISAELFFSSLLFAKKGSLCHLSSVLLRELYRNYFLFSHRKQDLAVLDFQIRERLLI